MICISAVLMSKQMKNMVKDCKYSQMEIFTLVITKTMLLNNTENTIGQVEHTIEASSCQECVMEKENGICCMETATKEIIWMTKRMEKVHIYGKMDPNILDNFKMITGMDMGRWTGMMEGSTKGNGSTEFKRMFR